jgi:HEAT repeat protein
VLASSIGSDYSPEGLANLVQQWKFSPVVIDWAWITAHWDQTNFTALNRFIKLMADKGVPVAAMYRPRFLNNPTVPIQVDRAGKPATSHGYYICFSSPEAREWGISWGTRILQKCPQINEIIIYNPLNQCQCPACLEAARNSPYAHYDAVWKFLAEAKAAWQKQKAGVKLGIVFVNDPEFWRRGAQVVDVAHPFLFITDNTDIAKDGVEASAIRDLLPGKTGPCLAKITWGPNDKVSPARLAEFDKSAAEAGLPYFFWTVETLFDSSLYDQQAVAQILRKNPLASDAQAVPTIPPQQEVSQPGSYSPDQSLPEAAAALLKQIMEGADQIAAMDSLVEVGRQSDAEGRRAIISAVAAAMNDKRRAEYPRWLCCKVLGGIADERAVPDLIQVLLREESEIVRYVAAEVVGEFYKNAKSTAAHDGLLQAARQETSSRVRETLARYLGQEMPAAPPRPETTAAGAAETNPPGGFHLGDLMYTPDQIRSTSAEVFLERMLKPEPRYGQFSAMNALAQKARESDPAARVRIISLVVAAMRDKSRPIYQRWQCCYVLSGCGDELAVPHLIQVLLKDESDTMRGVAAEALADFPKSAAAHDALLQAARQETNPTVREVLTRRLGQAMPAPLLVPAATPSAVEERAPSGAPQPPPAPRPLVTKPLPWPFPGNEENQNIFNNYQQATDIYIHCGLDFIQPAGTPVTAVESGYVAAIFTNYPDWITHYLFIVTPKKGGNEGWCYTHLDPRTFTFKEGDFIRQGQKLGSLVDFSVGNKPGVAHLHLHYVSFTRDASGKVNVHSLIDPLYSFDWKDTEPPVFQPLRFVTEGTLQQFQAHAAGVVTVSGRVDILAAVTDSAFPGHMGNLGVPVVMFSISDGTHTMQKLVVDHRGDVGDETQVKPLYLSYDEKKAFLNPDSFPRYQMLRVTKTDGDGRITPRDATECWDTTARDRSGKSLWLDGQYSVNVYAWDIAGNQAVVGAIVQVKNR